MKTGKKLMSLLLVLVLVGCISTGALASGAEEIQTGTITIQDAVPKQTYSIYKLFDLTYSGSGTELHIAYVYDRGTETAPNPWNGFFIGEGAVGANYVTITDEGTVSWNTGTNYDDATVALFAQAALSYAQKNENISAYQTATAGEPTDPTYTRVTVTFENVPLGYYLVDSTLGALCSLTSVTPAASINEKNGVPYLEKAVSSNGTDFGWYNDSFIGDTVYYKIDVIVRKGMENYVVYDLMPAGLTLNEGSISVATASYVTDGEGKQVYDGNGNLVYNDPVTVTNTPDKTYYTFEKAPEGETTYTFKVSLDSAAFSNLRPDDRIVIKYNAVLNDNAVIGNNGNINTAWLTYGSGGESDKDTTETYTWLFRVEKKDATTNAPLSGAVFQLSTDPEGANILKFNKIGEEGNQSGEPAAVGETEATYVYNVNGKYDSITTDGTGIFGVQGLDSGDYYLHEITAPDGYIKLEKPVKITIHAITQGEGSSAVVIQNISIDDGDRTENRLVTVANTAGQGLPSTGGIGTTIFYIVGAVLVVGAAVILVVRRRMSVEK